MLLKFLKHRGTFSEWIEKTFNVDDDNLGRLIGEALGEWCHRHNDKCESYAESTKPEADFRRTVISIYKQTIVGQDLFILGTDDNRGAIDIKLNEDIGGVWAEYDAWGEGVKTLDITPNEGQTTELYGMKALGLPLRWTSDNEENELYDEFNDRGDHVWIVDMEMDCSQTEDGWFAYKVIMVDRTIEEGHSIIDELAMDSATSCDGDEEEPAITTEYHLARCGAINTAEFQVPDCSVQEL